jgi:hypothetical protein
MKTELASYEQLGSVGENVNRQLFMVCHAITDRSSQQTHQGIWISVSPSCDATYRNQEARFRRYCRFFERIVLGLEGGGLELAESRASSPKRGPCCPHLQSQRDDRRC